MSDQRVIVGVPAGTGGKREQEHGDRDNCSADEAEVGFESGQSHGGRGQTRLPGVGNDDDESSHGADDDGVNENFEAAPHTLFDGVVYDRSCVYHRGSTPASFVGVQSSLDTLGDGDGQRCACETAGCSGRGECVAENQAQSVRHVADVLDDDDQSKDNVQNAHERNHLGCEVADSLQTAGYDDGQQDREYCRCDDHADSGEGGADRLSRVVVLHGEDEGDKDTEREDDREDLVSASPFLFFTETILHVVGRAAYVTLAGNVGSSVVQSQSYFSALGHHTYQSDQPDPEDGTRAARCDSGSNTTDVAGTDSAADCDGSSLERGDGAFAFGLLSDRTEGRLHDPAEVCELEESGTDRDDGAGTKKQDDQRSTPDEPVHGINDIHETHYFTSNEII